MNQTEQLKTGYLYYLLPMSTQLVEFESFEMILYKSDPELVVEEVEHQEIHDKNNHYSMYKSCNMHFPQQHIYKKKNFL